MGYAIAAVVFFLGLTLIIAGVRGTGLQLFSAVTGKSGGQGANAAAQAAAAGYTVGASSTMPYTSDPYTGAPYQVTVA